jgi:hypothetical protein
MTPSPTEIDRAGLHYRVELIGSFIVFVFHSLFSVGIAIMALMAAIVVVIDRHEDLWMRLLQPAGCALLIALELWHLRRTYVLMEARRLPLSLNLALGHPRLPWILRPIISAFWLAHFGAVVWFALLLHRQWSLRWDWVGEGIVRSTAYLALVAGFTHGAMGYLLLCVGALAGHDGLLRRIWAGRTVIDLVVAGAVISYVWFGPTL